MGMIGHALKAPAQTSSATPFAIHSPLPRQDLNESAISLNAARLGQRTAVYLDHGSAGLILDVRGKDSGKAG
jgi:hypothetical protein